MQYSVAHFRFSDPDGWQKDVLFQQLADLGYETFDGDDAYIRTALLDAAQTEATTASIDGAELIGIESCPDENWNATWEAEHEVIELPLGIRIAPHCAFGAGHHETTGMMIDALLNHLNQPAGLLNHVLDMGCGTGVLGIFAAKLGATHVTSVDIDDKSVANTLENIVLNGLNEDLFTLVCSGTVPDGQYDLILANIHRNILIAQMPDYVCHLTPGGELWLSGFYDTDIAPLLAEANKHNLTHLATHARGDWRMLQLKKN